MLRAYQTSDFAYQGEGLFAYQDEAGDVPVVDVYPGSGRPVDWQGPRRKLKLKEQPEKHLRSILDKVVAEYYGELVSAEIPKSVKAEAADVVRPYVSKDSRGNRVPQPDKVDWQSLEANASAVAAIIGLWNQEIRRYENEDDDDDAILMMLS